MIKLAPSAVAEFDFLAAPPTHAKLISRHVAHIEERGFLSLKATYNLGTINAAGDFVATARAMAVVFELPTRFAPDADRAREDLMLAALLGAGVVPNPSDPTTTVAVPKKVAGDHKTEDIDAIAAAHDPRLAGTIV